MQSIIIPLLLKKAIKSVVGGSGQHRVLPNGAKWYILQCIINAMSKRKDQSSQIEYIVAM